MLFGEAQSFFKVPTRDGPGLQTHTDRYHFQYLYPLGIVEKLLLKTLHAIVHKVHKECVTMNCTVPRLSSRK